MKVAVTSEGNALDAPLSPIFGRCRYIMLVDTETMAAEAMTNPNADAYGGAGGRSAQMLAELGVDAVVSGNVGPNAMHALQAAGIPVYLAKGGTVEDAVRALAAGSLTPAASPSVASDFGKGLGGQGAGLGRGGGRGRGGA